MRNAAFAILFAVTCGVGVAQAGLDGSVYLMPVDTSFSSVGEAVYVDALQRIDSSVTLSGEHTVTQPGIVYTTPVSGAGSYSGTLSGPAQASICYSTSLHVLADPPGWFNEHEQTWSGETRCAPPPPPPPKDSSQLPGCPQSPIVIALQGRYDFTDPESGVWFDIDADGDRDRVSWPADGSVAFLFFDRNGNGLPDDGSELFGDHTPLRSGATSRHGFEALAELDSNGDGQIEPDDLLWTRLRLWQDVNHDGVASRDEISTLGAKSVTSLGLTYHWTGRQDRHGNLFRWSSHATFSGRQLRPYYDVYLMTGNG